MNGSSSDTPTLMRFGKYDLLEKLPGGGMADVYRARDTVTNKIVAVKILKPEYAADPEFKSRFLDEARTAAPLENPHIINVFDFGEADGRPYMVMEFLRGHDLRAYIGEAGGASVVDKLRIALQVATALEYIHEHDIVHRDVKPDNIHVNTSGHVRLLDFGIAKSSASSTRTRAGFAVGTVAYMAPEQLMGKTSKSVDVYAFGLVVYEMLTGIRPVSGSTTEQMYYQILKAPLDLEPLKRNGVPDRVIKLIRCCTEKDPDARPRGFSEIREQLDREIQTIESAATRSEPVRRPMAIPVWGYVVSAAVVAAAGLAVWAIVRVPKDRDAGVVPGPTSGPPVVTNPPEQALPPVLKDPAGDMVLVRAGPFKFGKPGEMKDESLPAFYIDRTEVTNAAYRSYADRQGVTVPKGKPDYPVVGVTVNDARAFCAWAGKRLPTAMEWEKAARGEDGRVFPWGEKPDPSKVRRQPMPADSLREGRSPCDAVHMAGNVWEFVADSRVPNKDEVTHFKDQGRRQATMRWPITYGGAFDFEEMKNLEVWDSAVVPPDYREDNLGFRCAKTPQ